MAFAITCPECRRTLTLEAVEEGMPLRCPGCGRRFRVRLPGQAEPKASAPAPPSPPLTPHERVTQLKRLYPDVLEPDLRFVVDFLGPDRLWSDPDELAQLKCTPRPGPVPEPAVLEALATSLAQRRQGPPESVPRPRAFNPVRIWILVLALDVPALAAVALLVMPRGPLQLLPLVLAVGLAVLAASELRRLRSAAGRGFPRVELGSPEEALHLFYQRGVLAGNFTGAARLVAPQPPDPAALAAHWQHELDRRRRLLTMPQFVTRIYEHLGPGYDVSPPQHETRVQWELERLSDQTARAQVTLTLGMQLEVTEQPAYRDWKREAPPTTRLCSQYAGWVGLVYDGRMWCVTDPTWEGFRLRAFWGEGALGQIKFEPGATAPGQLDVAVIDECILHAESKPRKRGYF